MGAELLQLAERILRCGTYRSDRRAVQSGLQGARARIHSEEVWLQGLLLYVLCTSR